MNDFTLFQKLRIRLRIWKRKRVQKKYGDLFIAISAALFKHDPIGINCDENTDEYDPETGTILPRLESCNSHHEARRVICEEFAGWFGAEYGKNEMHYDLVSKEVWDLWCSSRASGSRA